MKLLGTRHHQPTIPSPGPTSDAKLAAIRPNQLASSVRPCFDEEPDSGEGCIVLQSGPTRSLFAKFPQRSCWEAPTLGNATVECAGVDAIHIRVPGEPGNEATEKTTKLVSSPEPTRVGGVWGRDYQNWGRALARQYGRYL